ncbi:MAG: TIGR03862 family flavoprotein [Gammaproteobacteria bacterium]|nr:TIGR03862 family flavoprotein [Gammaproteobacteria bacterium]MBU1645718.1 TIGR03862 family flavoprotein [Gammaproteobacteria bacterium]MBU1971226.1 TIGR03862 family flavoprotein [Gammaproteobacteria bacterium]
MSEIRCDGGRAAVIGGGPAGLMAAEVLASAGVAVDVYDAMPSVGRKFLMAGKSGLNLTHAEPFADFATRYGARRDWVEPWLAEFGADALRGWALGLGIETFVGSSGRVFPNEMKAAPLLRAWVHRLRAAGVRFHMRHRWLGWRNGEELLFATPSGTKKVGASGTAVILALGGGSWPKLGSDGAWVPWLGERGVSVAPLRPANCGFDVQWSEHFRNKFAGQPLKSVVATFGAQSRQGDFVVTEHGVEGSLIYTFSAALCDAIEATGGATLALDLAPGRSIQRLTEEIAHPRGSRSMASHLQGRVGIAGVKAGLLREFTVKDDYADPARLAAAIKALPLRLVAPRPLAEAISSAGGVARDAFDERLMLRDLPGVFCAGEMLDWAAPTGGYLLTACFASGHAAGKGALAWLRPGS